MTRALVTWRVRDVPQALEEDDAALRATACRAVGVDEGELRGFRIARRSLDARRRRGIFRYVCQVDLVLGSRVRPAGLRRALKKGRVVESPPLASPFAPRIGPDLHNVAVLGSGPAGLFAAYVLSGSGVRVTLVDRGARLEERGPRVVAFHRKGVPDPETNLLFGEGGAGTYSDGKLYTRVDDPLEVPLLEELVECGAPPGIVFDARAHIGTDRLHRVLPRLRERLEANGVEFHFDTRVDGLVLEEGTPRRVRALRTSAGELACDAVILAPGHSARDCWEWLHEEGVVCEAKPFQFGVRVEHPQELVTAGRFGAGPEAELLGAASYNLTSKGSPDAPGAHSFCMCPGGRIVASVNEAGRLCTNGMSNSTHSSRWANAAVVSTVGPADYVELLGEAGEGPFGGVAFQRHFEEAFFEAGGGDYTAPAQRVPDFLAGRESQGKLATSYTFGARSGRIDRLLPPAVRAALAQALERFDRAIEGFAGPEGLLVGVESRSSGPVRLTRGPESRLALGFSNLYPVGEGAGYAGGIMSAALDGAHAALALCAASAR